MKLRTFQSGAFKICPHKNGTVELCTVKFCATEVSTVKVSAMKLDPTKIAVVFDVPLMAHVVARRTGLQFTRFFLGADRR